MSTFHYFALRLATIGMIIITSISVCGQAPSTASAPSITVSITVDKNTVPTDQSPWTILNVKNLADHEVAIHDYAVRLHVEGKHGEPPTTLIQRMSTGKLQPGDRPLRTDEYVVWTIPPGELSSHKYKLSYFYDLSASGKYTVYLEVMDPVSQKWLRTNTAKFEMQAPAP
jgi:hypothetical protein